MTRPEEEPAARRRFGRQAVLLALAALAALGVIGWAIAHSIDRSEGAEDTSERALSSAVAAWDKTGGDEISHLLARANTLAADVRQQRYTVIGADADALDSVITTADAEPVVPDDSGNDEWETALAEYSSAVQSALAASGSSTDRQDLSNAVNEVGAGDADISGLDQRIHTLTG